MLEKRQLSSLATYLLDPSAFGKDLGLAMKASEVWNTIVTLRPRFVNTAAMLVAHEYFISVSKNWTYSCADLPPPTTTTFLCLSSLSEASKMASRRDLNCEEWHTGPLKRCMVDVRDSGIDTSLQP